MAALLGAHVTLCAVLGGESGRVLRGLIEAEHVALDAVPGAEANAAYVHDRRGGERTPIAEEPSLSRHETDALYGLALSAGLHADAALLTGSADPAVIDAAFYERLAGDLRSNGTIVTADLSGDQLRAALAGGVDVVKISDDRIVTDGYAVSQHERDLVAGLAQLRQAGARNALVSRAGNPALAMLDDRVVKLAGPELDALDSRGAGDSQSAAIAVGLARGSTIEAALRLGMAAGAVNVTRRGPGSGERFAIERLFDHIEIHDHQPGPEADSGAR